VWIFPWQCFDCCYWDATNMTVWNRGKFLLAVLANSKFITKKQLLVLRRPSGLFRLRRVPSELLMAAYKSLACRFVLCKYVCKSAIMWRVKSSFRRFPVSETYRGCVTSCAQVGSVGEFSTSLALNQGFLSYFVPWTHWRVRHNLQTQSQKNIFKCLR
jgi:hypothetical protein